MGRPGLLETALLATLERTLNAALRSDPATAQRLAALSGHCLELRLRLPARRIQVQLLADGVQCSLDSDLTPTMTLEGSAVDLAARFLDWPGAGSPVGGPVRIGGDTQALQTLSALLRELQLDWGALLAPWLGPELAQQLDTGLRQLGLWARDSFQRLSRQAGDYLQQESGLLPSRHALREFGHDVEELQLATDRLEARLRALQARCPPAPESPQA